MIHTKPSPNSRPGFTLVELMVSLALILFIMAILSQAFVVGMDTFREMKGIGDMEERLRSATQILRRDLAADHFEGRRRLSDPTFWDTQVREGFFRINQGGASIDEGADPDQIKSFRANNHSLHFSAKLRGNDTDQYFAGNLPMNWNGPGPPVPDFPFFYYSPLVNGPAVSSTFFNQSPVFQHWHPPVPPNPPPPEDTFWPYHSPWAEIAYALELTGSAGSTPLFALRRYQRVVTPDNSKLNWPRVVDFSQPPLNSLTPLQMNAMVTGYAEMAAIRVPPAPPPPPPPPPPSYLYFSSPSDLADPVSNPPDPSLPTKRSLDAQQPLSLSMRGSGSILLTDVISFDIRVLKYFLPTPQNPAGILATEFDDLVPLPANAPPPPWVVDTYRPATSPPFDAPGLNPPSNPGYLIKALQISIRVWDSKTQQTRQVTIVQEM